MAVKLFSDIPVLQDERLVLKPLVPSDADALRELVDDPLVYRYLPTFLFEKKYPDLPCVISRLYDECLQESLILGIFEKGAGAREPAQGDARGGSEELSFCGLAEMYGYREEIHKVSVGYRLLARKWGQGIASNALKLMIRYLCDETGIEIITASTMVENQASASVLRKNGFDLVASGVDEDWGYGHPTVTDKWIR